MSEDKAKFAYFKQVAIGAASGLATLALIIAGFSISGSASLPSDSSNSQNTAEVSGSPTPTPTDSLARTCSVATEAADPLLATFSASIINPATDEVLFDRNGETAAAPASTMKLLTAAAALQVLGPRSEFTDASGSTGWSHNQQRQLSWSPT